MKYELICSNCFKKFYREYKPKYKKNYCCFDCLCQGRKGGNKTSFKKGHKSWNTVMKGTHLSPNTEFKKGILYYHTKYDVGTIVERKDRNGKIRKFIKIADPNKWNLYYKYIWEKENGKVPKGFVLHHINKISNDDRIENLILLTRKEHINIHRKDLEKKKV